MDFLHHPSLLFHAEGIRYLIESFGLPAVCAIAFAESGVFPMLPGDSLLVLCGIYAATPGPGGSSVLSLASLLTLVPLCAVVGGQIGHGVGRWAGPSVWRWKEHRLWRVPLYRREWLQQTDAFYKRWGVFAVVASRWVPFVRTFAPLLAGVTGMGWPGYLTFNLVGALSWVWSMVLLGYYLPPVTARYFPAFRLEDNIERIALAVIVLSLLPIAFTWWKERGARKKNAPARRAAKGKAGKKRR